MTSYYYFLAPVAEEDELALRVLQKIQDYEAWVSHDAEENTQGEHVLTEEWTQEDSNL